MAERTLVVIKPDGVTRGLTGSIIGQFERCGLRVTRLEMRYASPDLIECHYPDDEFWLSEVGRKTAADYARLNRQTGNDFATADPTEIGRIVRKWLIAYLTSGPVVALVLTGSNATAKVRRLCGDTIPAIAQLASVRGRYSALSAVAANSRGEPVRNIVHASSDVSEAEREIELWFPGTTQRTEGARLPIKRGGGASVGRHENSHAFGGMRWPLTFTAIMSTCS